MTCAKMKVTCTITTVDGQIFYGENACNNPQTICPRLTGEGYAKCKDICWQPGHAETVAMMNAKNAGADLTGATAEIFGQYRVCQDCARALKDAGIAKYIVYIL